MLHSPTKCNLSSFCDHTRIWNCKNYKKNKQRRRDTHNNFRLFTYHKLNLISWRVITAGILSMIVKWFYHNTIQYDTIQYDTIQYNTIPYIIIKYEAFVYTAHFWYWIAFKSNRSVFLQNCTVNLDTCTLITIPRSHASQEHSIHVP